MFAHSGADIEQLSKRLAEEHTQGIAIAQVTPNPYKISTRLTKEFQDAIAKAGSLEAPVSYAMLEGYIAARVIVEAVRRMGAKPDRDQFPKVLETIDGFDMGGYANPQCGVCAVPRARVRRRQRWENHAGHRSHPWTVL